MPAKLDIVRELGEDALLVPELTNRALQANDRVKYLFSLLQAAKEHADRPDRLAPNLRSERERSGVLDAFLDDVVGASRKEGEHYVIPRASWIRSALFESTGQMITPLAAAVSTHDEPPQLVEEFQLRLERLAGDRCIEGDQVARKAVGALTSAQREAGDSLHLLVMDLHKELNRLQASLAKETIEGAYVYGIDESDRPLIEAFMRGLNATAPLKFEHPGLGCTATRAGRKLMIQNDIGTTDAHVLVVNVEGRTVDVTYTDVHDERTRFFRSLFQRFDVEWNDPRLRSADGWSQEDVYYLCTGRLSAADEDELAAFLAFIGSRLVFLIDWNKARKRLRNFLKKRDCIAILRWAANHDYGHRAFLQLGGERLIYDTVEQVVTAPIRYGQPLLEVLGRDQTLGFLRGVLRRTSQGLLKGHSERLIRDEIRADLISRLNTAAEGHLSTAGDHAALVFELACKVRDALASFPFSDNARLERNARRASEWERKADELVNRLREMAKRSTSPGAELYFEILKQADDAADCLEDAAFLLTLLPAAGHSEPHLEALRKLARLVVEACQEYVKGLEGATWVHRTPAREDVDDFLLTIDRLVALEHETDDMEREVTARLIREPVDARQIHLYSNIAAALEDSVDALYRCGYLLRDHVLGQVMVG